MLDHQVAVLEKLLAQGRHSLASHFDVRQRRNEPVETGKITDNGPDLCGLCGDFHRGHDVAALRIFNQGIGL
ncbi:hypothetical protein D3C87_1047340 [compost metagenome]